MTAAVHSVRKNYGRMREDDVEAHTTHIRLLSTNILRQPPIQNQSPTTCLGPLLYRSLQTTR